MKKIMIFPAIGIFLSITLLPLSARNAKKFKEMDDFYPEFPMDNDIKTDLPDKSLKTRGIQYGIWLTPSLIYMDRGYSEQTLSVTKTRIWAKSYLWNDSFLYARGIYVYTGTVQEEGKNPSFNDHHYDLDVGYLSIASHKRRVQFYLGRRFFRIGSGLVLNGRGDGGELDFYSKYISFRLLASYTGFLRKQSNPYGINIRDISSGTRRVFSGGEVSFGLGNQTLYAFGMAQFDFNFQKWYYRDRYDSRYYGIGIKGVLFKGLSYNGEVVYERGRTYILGYRKMCGISALAALFNVRYYLKLKLYPVLIAQYAFGSGDSKRFSYKMTNGNTLYEDNGFMHFGVYLGGYALRPLLGNMHIIRAGFSLAPFSWSKVLYVRSMSIISKYSVYLKNRNAGYINSGEAPRNNRLVGHGGEVSLRWLIFSDISAFFSYSFFMPGNAYYTHAADLIKFQLTNTQYVNYMIEKRRDFIMFGFNISL